MALRLLTFNLPSSLVEIYIFSWEWKLEVLEPDLGLDRFLVWLNFVLVFLFGHHHCRLDHRVVLSCLGLSSLLREYHRQLERFP